MSLETLPRKLELLQDNELTTTSLLFWNRDDLIKVMKAVVVTKNRGFILEQDLAEEVGRKKVI
ncbi:25922_t:CDS:2 [Gigaspora rosea]|nr:25922_t:CDS:2 [Gigaspora rosea]